MRKGALTPSPGDAPATEAMPHQHYGSGDDAPGAASSHALFALPMKNKLLHHLWCLNNLRWGCLSHRGIQIIHLNPPSPYPVRHSMEMQQTQSKKCQQLTFCGSKGKCVVLFLITTHSEWSFFQNDLQPRNNLIWRFFFYEIKEPKSCLRGRYKLLLKKKEIKNYIGFKLFHVNFPVARSFSPQKLRGEQPGLAWRGQETAPCLSTSLTSVLVKKVC